MFEELVVSSEVFEELVTSSEVFEKIVASSEVKQFFRQFLQLLNLWPNRHGG